MPGARSLAYPSRKTRLQKGRPMASRKKKSATRRTPAAKQPARGKSPAKSPQRSGLPAREATSSAKSTVSAPAQRPAPEQLTDAATAKLAGTEALAAAFPFNAAKPSEFSGDSPAIGQCVAPPDPLIAGSTLTETNPSPKVGSGTPPLSFNPAAASLNRVRVDSSGRALTTNQGVPVSDNQNSLKAGLRGPTLMEDFILREKITHFDHERIPERIVHARGSGAHGYFQPYKSMKHVTSAGFLSDPKIKTPVFVRFSTVAGGAGSVDLPRDVRGFAVKFYTQEGNFDLVGNNIPVFFIQDAIKFPDLIHSVKMEADRGFPQAASAHDTFWDFVSLMPESTHHVLWAMSDRALPPSVRMMEGFGIHTFRLVNRAGKATFVKFHWKPKLGLQSTVWD